VPDLTYFICGRLLQGGQAMGLVLNLLLSGVALVVGSLVGVPLGVFRAMTRPSLQAPLSLVLGVIRGTPLLLLVLWTYLLIQVVARVPLAPIWIGCVGLGLYAATHISDIVRAGARAVPREQIRAAEALGLTPLQIAAFVLMPVSLRLMLPALTTFTSSLFKDSSVCYVIGVIELMQLAVLESSRNPRFLLEYYALMAFIFLVVTLVGTRLAARLERRLRIPGIASPLETVRASDRQTLAAALARARQADAR